MKLCFIKNPKKNIKYNKNKNKTQITRRDEYVHFINSHDFNIYSLTLKQNYSQNSQKLQ